MSITREIVVLPIVHFVEILAGGVILMSVLWAVVRFLRGLLPNHPFASLVELRLHTARYLLLGLEFLIAAELLRTILRPSLEEMTILGAIVLIRIALGLDLRYEVRHLPREPKELEDDV